MNDETSRRAVVVCADCGRVFAATVSTNERIRLIGRPNGCGCGSTEFLLPEDAERE